MVGIKERWAIRYLSHKYGIDSELLEAFLKNEQNDYKNKKEKNDKVYENFVEEINKFAESSVIADD